MIRGDLRADRDQCRFCTTPLADADIISRSWSTVPSGEWQGDDGYYVTLQCQCGRKTRLLWTVNMAPWQGQAI